MTRSKYSNVKTNGYASKKEAKRAQELKLRVAAKEIRGLREQVPYVLIPRQKGERACTYVADFVYESCRPRLPHDPWGDSQIIWEEVVEDVKGVRTDVYRIKRKLMLHVHGVRIREV